MDGDAGDEADENTDTNWGQMAKAIKRERQESDDGILPMSILLVPARVSLPPSDGEAHDDIQPQRYRVLLEAGFPLLAWTSGPGRYSSWA